MRFVYLDEAGIGNVLKEPCVVVAGVIVNADTQWQLVEDHLAGLVDKHVHPDARRGFCFHAKDIHHGSGSTPRVLYPRPARQQMLLDLCAIPKRLGLPVVAGIARKRDMASLAPQKNAQELNVDSHTLASILCAGTVERYMRAEAPAGEVASLIYENNDHARRDIKHMHRMLRELSLPAGLETGDLGHYVPFQRIVDTAHFAAKTETSILQVADACAFAIRRYAIGKDSDGYYDQLKDMMLPVLDTGEALI